MKKRLRGWSLFSGLLILWAPGAVAQNCTHLIPGKPVVDTQYYQDHGYTIESVRVVSPYDFFFLISRRLDAIKKGLPIQEKQIFTRSAYSDAKEEIDSIVEKDSAFGEDSPFKLAFATANLDNCDERDDHRTVGVVYYVFSTDPLSMMKLTPEQRNPSTAKSAVAVAEHNTQGTFTLKPLAGYNYSYKGFGGGEAILRPTTKGIDQVRVAGSGSASTLLLDAEMSGSGTTNHSMLATASYQIGYHYYQNPTQNIQLTTGTGHLRFAAVSKQFGSQNTQVSFRYGTSFEQGIQQSSLPVNSLPQDTVANSRYGAVRVYLGGSASTRYSETSASYGLEVGGAGLSSLSFVKQVGDFNYALRFPGHTHAPWGLEFRATGGGITGGPVLLNDRFFGGNVVAPFIPGDSWLIPDGPLVRSITANYLNGRGLGGTSFYSTNVTVGKVVKSWPMIPKNTTDDRGFSDGVAAGENTAEGFFADGYLADSDQFKGVVAESGPKLSAEVDEFRTVVGKVRKSVTITPELDQAFKNCEDPARGVRNELKNLNEDTTKVRALYGPKSKLISLLNSLPELIKLVPETFQPELQASQDAMQKTLSELQSKIQAVENGPVGQDARLRAQQDLARPREIIDTLISEANIFSVGVFGIFDTGRVWPDPIGTRYAYGGGVRLSIVNINFNLGYAVNPNPQSTLNQGRGALLVFITYTNLFR